MYVGNLCPINFVVSFIGLHHYTNNYDNKLVFAELILSVGTMLITLYKLFYLVSYFALSLWLLIEHGLSFIF